MKNLNTNNLEVKQKNIKHKALKFSFKIFILVLVLGTIFYAIFSFNENYKNKIYPHIYISGQNVGNMTKDEAIKNVNIYLEKIDNDGPQIAYKSQTLNPKFSQLGVSFNINETVDQAFGYARNQKFEGRLVSAWNLVKSNKKFVLTPNIDETKLNDYFDFVAKSIETKPVNSTGIYQDGHFIVTTAKSGFGLDKKIFSQSISAYLAGNLTRIDLKISALEPTINEEKAVTAINQAEEYLKNAPILIKYDSKQFIADRAEIASWVKFKENGDNLEAFIDDNKINQFVNNLAAEIEVPKVDKEVVIDSGKILNEGADGLGVDKDKLVADIKSKIFSHSSGDIILTTFFVGRGEKQVPAQFVPGEYAGRFIEVNLSSQTLFAWENNKVVNQFLISSGTYSHITPSGIYAVWTKVRVQTMDGPGYSLPNVQWISYFNGEIGVHGTYWHNNFGHPMSHGCINASNDNAEWIYNWDSVGTPVWVHE